MEKSYTQKVHYCITLEGDWSCGDMWEEDLYKNAEDAHDSVLDYICENFADLIYENRFRFELTDLRTVEES